MEAVSALAPSAEMASLLNLYVAKIIRMTKDVVTVELRRPDDPKRQLLPSFEPGAHLDIVLPNGIKRSYSITSFPDELDHYTIAVKNQKPGRGGSRFIHESLKVGDVCVAAPPRSSFRIDGKAAGHLFIAGGIGITPFIGMIRQAEVTGSPWALAYAFRDPEPPFLEQIKQLAGKVVDRVRLHAGGRSGANAMNVRMLVSELPADWSVYCCGPESLLNEFEAATKMLDPNRVRLERFSNTTEVRPDEGFVVELARSGRELSIQPNESILDALEMEGVDVPWGCREGLCGTCEVSVISGIPRHYDKVLSEEQKRSNKSIIVCCSRSLTQRLVLDL